MVRGVTKSQTQLSDHHFQHIKTIAVPTEGKGVSQSTCQTVQDKASEEAQKGTPLVVQGLKRHAPSTGDTASIAVGEQRFPQDTGQSQKINTGSKEIERMTRPVGTDHIGGWWGPP